MKTPSPQTAKLELPGQEPIYLPIINGSLGPQVLDISSLHKYGYFTYDPGFMSTAACESKITYIDGDAGVLLHRGYPIEYLVANYDYLTICYLLLNGQLPDPKAKQSFDQLICKHTLVHEQLRDFFYGFPRNSHPMAIMCAALGGLSAFYHDALNIRKADHRELTATRLIAKMPTMAAMAYKYSIGQPFVYPRNDLDYASNFLHMMFAVPAERERDPDPILANAIDKILSLHADHEQNVSTSTVRAAGSSAANPYACIAAGIAALWGPAHGGANEAVLNMLEQIASVDNINTYLQKAKDKDDGFRLMGFGHRVYKNYDPRAKIMREICHQVLDHLALADEPIFKLALKLEEIALADEYFIAKKLYPNVDFYSGIVLRALKIPKNMFTVMFALGRTIGWISHWKEMLDENTENLKIQRPRQLYTGLRPEDVMPD